jgi:dsDNA-specific endonuclease/ATPase MutS2
VSTWLAAFVLATGPGDSVTPITAATSDVVTYILGYGVLGIVALAFAFRFIVPRGTVDQARAEGRADLLKENARLIEEKKQAEEQRDETLRMMNQQVVPILASFTGTAQSLIPLLQALVQQREIGRQAGRRDD